MTRAERRDLLYSIAVKSPDRKLLRKYWRSDRWKQIRMMMLTLHPVCELCQRRKATQVHHKTYATLFNEDLNSDLVATCARCHRYISRR